MIVENKFKVYANGRALEIIIPEEVLFEKKYLKAPELINSEANNYIAMCSVIAEKRLGFAEKLYQAAFERAGNCQKLELIVPYTAKKPEFNFTIQGQLELGENGKDQLTVRVYSNWAKKPNPGV